MIGELVEGGGRLEAKRQIKLAYERGDLSAAGEGWHALEDHSRRVRKGLIVDEPAIDPEKSRKAAYTDPKEIIAGQVNTLVRLGFHHALGVPETVYRASMPEPAGQRPEEVHWFDVPLLVDGRVPATTQYDLIRRDIPPEGPNFTSHIPLPAVEHPSSHPDVAFVGWTQIGRPIQRLEEGEVAGTLADALALKIHYPTVFRREGVAAIGSLIPVGTRRFEEGGYPSVDVRHITRVSTGTERAKLTRSANITLGTPLPQGR